MLYPRHWLKCRFAFPSLSKYPLGCAPKGPASVQCLLELETGCTLHHYHHQLREELKPSIPLEYQTQGQVRCQTTRARRTLSSRNLTTITQPSHLPYYCFTSGTVTNGSIHLQSEVSVAPDNTAPRDVIEYTIPLHSLIHYGVAERLSATYHNSPVPLTILYTTPQYPGAQQLRRDSGRSTNHPHKPTGPPYLSPESLPDHQRGHAEPRNAVPLPFTTFHLPQQIELPLPVNYEP